MYELWIYCYDDLLRFWKEIKKSNWKKCRERVNKFMVLIVGIVGLFNVGKLILFNVIIKVGVEVVNYFFVMIDFNVGMVEVFDWCL